LTDFCEVLLLNIVSLFEKLDIFEEWKKGVLKVFLGPSFYRFCQDAPKHIKFTVFLSWFQKLGESCKAIWVFYFFYVRCLNVKWSLQILPYPIELNNEKINNY